MISSTLSIGWPIFLSCFKRLKHWTYGWYSYILPLSAAGSSPVQLGGAMSLSGQQKHLPCGHLCGWHITATIATPDIVLVGFFLTIAETVSFSSGFAYSRMSALLMNLDSFNSRHSRLFSTSSSLRVVILPSRMSSIMILHAFSIFFHHCSIVNFIQWCHLNS